MEEFTTKGEESILLDMVKPTKQITLHVHPNILIVTHSWVKVKYIWEKRIQLKGMNWMQRS